MTGLHDDLCATRRGFACNCPSAALPPLSRRQRDKEHLIALFTEVLDRYLEAVRERDQVLNQNMLMKPNKRRDTTKLEARVIEKRATLIEAYTVALGD